VHFFQGHHRKAAANERLPEAAALLRGQLAQDVAALAFHRCGYLAGEIGGDGGGPGRVGEDVEVGEGESGNEAAGFLEVGVGLAGEADHHVGAEGGLRHEAVGLPDAAGVVAGTIAAVHMAQDTVGAGLQGRVYVAGDAGRGG